MWYHDKLYVMLINSEQGNRIDHAAMATARTDRDNGTREYWSDVTRRFLLQHNARFGQVIITYNPYSWKKELIFNTEQDATMFCLKVL